MTALLTHLLFLVCGVWLGWRWCQGYYEVIEKRPPYLLDGGLETDR